jgi:hypothetical protein
LRAIYPWGLAVKNNFLGGFYGFVEGCVFKDILLCDSANLRK